MGLESVGLSVIELFVAHRSSKLGRKAIMRAIHLECEYNLALLRTLKLDDHSVDQCARGYLVIASQLESKALISLCDARRVTSRLLADLSSIPICEAEGEASDDRSSDRRKPSIAERAIRLAVSVAAARRIAEIMLSQSQNEMDGLARVNLRTRLKNIQSGLKAVSAAFRRYLD